MVGGTKVSPYDSKTTSPEMLRKSNSKSNNAGEEGKATTPLTRVVCLDNPNVVIDRMTPLKYLS
jgi:hypothetical protein